MAGSGTRKSQEALKNQAMLVVRNITKQEVTNVIFPNGITVGAEGVNFRNGFKVHGNAQISGIVNAQGFKVNGSDLSSGTADLRIDLTENNFVYGSNNPNESGTQTFGSIQPESIDVKIIQASQASTLTESDVSVLGSNSVSPLTSSIAISATSTGNSISTFTLTPQSGSSFTEFPVTISVTNDGITSVKRIRKLITPTLINFEPLLDANTISASRNTLTTGDLWMFENGVLTNNTNIVGFNSGRQGPVINFSKKVSDSNAQLPTSFSSGSSCPETMFYKGPTTGRSMIRQVTGHITFVPASFSSGQSLQLILALYKSAVSGDYKTFTLLKEWDKQTFDSNNTTTLLGIGGSSSTSITPTAIGSSDGLSLGMYIYSVQGSPSTAGVQISGNFYVEYEVGTI